MRAGPVVHVSSIAALEGAGYRLTGPRRAVADLITRREGHFTAADLLDDAVGRRPAIARATIFRTLDLLEGVGAIERIDLPSGDHAYIACEPADHHHHVVCATCGERPMSTTRGWPEWSARLPPRAAIGSTSIASSCSAYAQRASTTSKRAGRRRRSTRTA